MPVFIIRIFSLNIEIILRFLTSLNIVYMSGPDCVQGVDQQPGGEGDRPPEEEGAGQPRHGLRLQRRKEQEERPAGGQGEARYVVAEIRELKIINFV